MNVVRLDEAIQQTLIDKIKTAVEAGDNATARSEQFYKEAGGYLKELKADKSKYTNWKIYVREECKISRTRADALIDLFDGEITLEELRAKSAESARKSRGQLRSGSEDDDDEEETEGKSRLPFGGNILKLAKRRFAEFIDGYRKEMKAKERHEYDEWIIERLMTPKIWAKLLAQRTEGKSR